MAGLIKYDKNSNPQDCFVFKTNNSRASRNRKIIPALLGVLSFVPTLVFADLPLTVEGLLSAQNRWRAELGINYANVEQRRVSTEQSA